MSTTQAVKGIRTGVTTRLLLSALNMQVANGNNCAFIARSLPEAARLLTMYHDILTALGMSPVRKDGHTLSYQLKWDGELMETDVYLYFLSETQWYRIRTSLAPKLDMQVWDTDTHHYIAEGAKRCRLSKPLTAYVVQ